MKVNRENSGKHMQSTGSDTCPRETVASFSPDWYSPKFHVLTPYSVGGMGLQHSKAVRSTRSLNTH